jgi:hypothetical protein
MKTVLKRLILKNRIGGIKVSYEINNVVDVENESGRIGFINTVEVRKALGNKETVEAFYE